MNCSLPGSSVHGIFQERTLKRVAISSSPGSGRFCCSTRGRWYQGFLGHREGGAEPDASPLLPGRRSWGQDSTPHPFVRLSFHSRDTLNASPVVTTCSRPGSVLSFLCEHLPDSETTPRIQSPGFPCQLTSRSTELNTCWIKLSKESASQCRRHKRCGFNPWVGKIPWSRKWQPTLEFLSGKFHGQKSLVVGLQSLGSQRVKHDLNTHTSKHG